MNHFPPGQGPPSDTAANLIFRILVLKKMSQSPAFAAAVVRICAQDACFFISTFGWVIEPRPRYDDYGRRLPKQLPFALWPHQKPVVEAIEKNLGHNDVIVDKARGEGATWIVIWMAIRTIVLVYLSKVGMVSHIEKQVYRSKDLGTLLGKFEYGIKLLPRAIVPDQNEIHFATSQGVIHYKPKKSMVNGYASTEDVASGDRLDWILMDELGKFPQGRDVEAVASVQAVTDCRIVVSTPKRAYGAYYSMVKNPSNAVLVVLDWTENPSRNKGLYRFRDGIPVAIDALVNPLPPHYNPPTPEVLQMFERLRAQGYNLGGVRSAWFDRECDRASATPEKIARELCRDFGGAETAVFKEGFFKKADESVREPDRRGDCFVRPGGILVNESAIGPLSLWMRLDAWGNPPKSSYIVGCDPARGESLTGANSVITAVDRRTRKQVLEYVTKIIEPKPMAELAIAISKWLYGAFLAWEQNGPGLPFGAKILELGYSNVYGSSPLDDRRRRGRPSKRAGWVSNPRTKEELFSELSDAVQTGNIEILSAECRDEARQYVLTELGKIEHVSVANNVPNHGDRVIALGVVAQAMKDRPYIPPSAENDGDVVAPWGSVAYRDQLHEARETVDDWDDRTLADLMGQGSYSLLEL